MVVPVSARSFLNRIRSGDTRNALYLSYYYVRLYVRDVRSGTKTAKSSAAPSEDNYGPKATGNFPFHPVLVRRALSEVPLGDRGSFLDVGCGSGVALREASALGYETVTGIELFPNVVELCRYNSNNPPGTPIEVIEGDALEMDLSGYRVVWLARPFVMIEDYDKVFTKLTNARWIFLANAPEIVPPGFTEQQCYQHPIYKRFNYRSFVRHVSCPSSL